MCMAKRLITVFLFGLLLMSCSDVSEVEKCLDFAESQMAENPETALRELDSLSVGRIPTAKLRARYSLLYTASLNKKYIDTTDVSVIAPAVKYYRYHGSADEKLLAYYYRGVIAINAGNLTQAMESYVQSEKYVRHASDKSAIARLYKAKMALYQEQEDRADAVCQGEIAAKYFLEAGDTTRYVNTLNDIAIQYSVMEDTVSASAYLDKVESYWDSLSDTQKSNYYSILLNTGHHDSVRSILDEYLNAISDPRRIKWLVVADKYAEINDYEKADYALRQYAIYDGRDQNTFYALDAVIQENRGSYKEALDSYKRYINGFVSDKLSAIESDARFVEERYSYKVKSVHQSHIIITIGLSLCFALVILLIVYRRMRQTRAEKKELELMSEWLQSEIQRLKQVRKNKSLDKDIVASVEQRLNVLNKFVMSKVSDSYSEGAYSELEELMSNPDDFIESTKNTFLVSKPKFITYLRKRQLTEREIGLCCLYCMGFSSSDVSEYLHRKSIYNVNSAIRQKLDIPKGTSKIDSFLRNLMKDF